MIGAVEKMSTKSGRPSYVRVVVGILCIAIIARITIASIDIPTTIADLLGHPSQVAMRNGAADAGLARHRYVAERWRRHHRHDGQRMPVAPDTDLLVKTYNEPLPPAPIIHPEPKLANVVQDVQVAFVTPDGTPISGLDVSY